MGSTYTYICICICICTCTCICRLPHVDAQPNDDLITLIYYTHITEHGWYFWHVHKHMTRVRCRLPGEAKHLYRKYEAQTPFYVYHKRCLVGRFVPNALINADRTQRLAQGKRFVFRLSSRAARTRFIVFALASLNTLSMIFKDCNLRARERHHRETFYSPANSSTYSRCVASVARLGECFAYSK